ncbi:methyltransferase-like protein [Annulohypoxylon moriforme]|nr:methyltransferase-like protein [Annulohypoxylon moriforme]
MESQLVKEYDTQGGRYSDYATQFPFAKIETELFQTVLGDCKGQTVLDLGGGSGLKAREAVDAGAVAVDVVDVSVSMMESGKEVEKSLGRESVINWHVGDVARDLSGLPLRPSYDLVIVGWTFDHAHDLTEYEGMWRNAAAYLKPGGRIVSVRAGDPQGAPWDGRYGVLTSAFEKTTDGFHYRYSFLLDPPLEFEASSVNVSIKGDVELPKKYGFTDFSSAAPEDSAVVKADPEFWKPFVDNPAFVVFQARKRADV